MTDHASACPAELSIAERGETKPQHHPGRRFRRRDCQVAEDRRLLGIPVGELAERKGFGRPCRGEDQVDVVGAARARKLIHASIGDLRPPAERQEKIMNPGYEG